MLDAIGKAGVGRLAAEMEIGLARMAHRPVADAVVEIEQAGLVGDLGARLGRDQAARRRRRDRRLLVARALADEAARADRAILDRRQASARASPAGASAATGRGRRQSLRSGSARRGGAGFGAAGLAALGAGAGLAFFSFSSSGLTGEGRDSRPRRCALPITALRLTPPSSSAIWLAVTPLVHIFFRRSIRSSVQRH